MRQPIDDPQSLRKCISTYAPQTPSRLESLETMLRVYPETQTFFTQTLPFIIDQATSLPLVALIEGRSNIPVQQPLVAGQFALDRTCCTALLANMFMCTFAAPAGRGADEYRCWTMIELLASDSPQAVSKLRMIVHYFDRVRAQPPVGKLLFYRCQSSLPITAWEQSTRLLQPADVAGPKQSMFDEKGYLTVDFANQFIGGGVLSRGATQEEIHFSMCPELCVSCLVCPRMRDNEAIVVIGAEQFCTSKGYTSKLQYTGDYDGPDPEVSVDGTLLNALTAIDALDGRKIENFSVQAQLHPDLMSRELNKALAGFGRVGNPTVDAWPIATGNWGCGAFGGFVLLKALLQWAAASQAERRLRYYPFDQHFGPELEAFCQEVSQAGTTVGQLVTALQNLRRKAAAAEQAAAAAAGKKGGRAGNGRTKGSGGFDDLAFLHGMLHGDFLGAVKAELVKLNQKIRRGKSNKPPTIVSAKTTEHPENGAVDTITRADIAGGKKARKKGKKAKDVQVASPEDAVGMCDADDIDDVDGAGGVEVVDLPSGVDAACGADVYSGVNAAVGGVDVVNEEDAEVIAGDPSHMNADMDVIGPNCVVAADIGINAHCVAAAEVLGSHSWDAIGSLVDLNCVIAAGELDELDCGEVEEGWVMIREDAV